MLIEIILNIMPLNHKLVLSCFLSIFIMMLMTTIDEKNPLGDLVLFILNIIYDISSIMMTLELAPYIYRIFNI
jgi:hypothetical protein